MLNWGVQKLTPFLKIGNKRMPNYLPTIPFVTSLAFPSFAMQFIDQKIKQSQFLHTLTLFIPHHISFFFSIYSLLLHQYYITFFSYFSLFFLFLSSSHLNTPYYGVCETFCKRKTFWVSVGKGINYHAPKKMFFTQIQYFPLYKTNKFKFFLFE